MSAGYVLSQSAFDDICQIWNYLAEKASSEMADRIEAQLFDLFETLSRFPNLGHRRLDITSRLVLFFPSKSFVVVYQPTEERVVVHAVLHAARDLKKVLKSRVPQ